MPPFHQRFTIHPVGQGLFYSCNIAHQNQIMFRMVVDCGSNTAKVCQEEVGLYRDSDYLTQKTLDLLVISHFDSDHVKYIGLLLQDDIKIKRLVMPFITFEERLFLVARHLGHSNGYKTEDDFALRFIIDPIGTIDNNLDGDSEIYFIEGNPNTPIPPANDDALESDDGSNNEARFLFDFDRLAKENFDLGSSITTSSPSKGKAYKVKDTNKGKLKGSFGIHKLMEFLFYKRAVGHNEEAFFKEVEALFNKKFNINNSLSLEARLKATIEKVRGVSSATSIKAIFKEAAKNVSLKPKGRIKIDDLNTTALCCLHRNLKGIFDLLHINDKDHLHYYHFYHEDIRQIQKFMPNSVRVETSWKGVNGYYRNYREWLDKGHFFYPNVLLTSDTFLLTKDQVDEFLKKYQHYWNDFWLFQIPHHGSENNGDKLLHASIPVSSFNFINYGIGNRDAHPSESVIGDLVATGHSSRMIPVNQISGLVFEFII